MQNQRTWGEKEKKRERMIDGRVIRVRRLGKQENKGNRQEEIREVN